MEWILFIMTLFSYIPPVQCSLANDTLTTFNNRRYRNEMPISCYQVLAQDCTPELKFMVLMKKDPVSEQRHITVKLDDV